MRSIKFIILLFLMVMATSLPAPAAKVHNVRFVDRFSGKEVVIATSLVKSGTKVKAPSVKGHSGYVLAGWDKSLNKVTSDMTVKAVWKQTKSIIFFTDTARKGASIVLNGQRIKLPGKPIWKMYIKTGGTVRRHPAGPEKNGYTFCKWEGMAGNSKLNIQKGCVLPEAKIIIAKPLFKANKYHIKFDSRGGTGIMRNKTVSYAGITLPSNQFKKPGKVFSGWKCLGKTYAAGDILRIEEIDEQLKKDEQGEATIVLQAVWKRQKWVFVGDSYGTTKTHPFVPDLIGEELQFDKYQIGYKNLCRGGYGISRARSENYGSFIDLIENETTDPDVTHLLIIGGITNDKKRSKSQIQKSIAEFKAAAAVKYPNAKIFYVICNWHANWTGRSGEDLKEVQIYHNRVIKRIPWYQEGCELNGITFIKGPEKTLRISNNDNLFNADGHHPNKNGKKLIARAIAEAFIKNDFA